MELNSLTTRNLAPGCQIQKLPKRIGKEKGPPEALLKCLIKRV